MEMIHGSSEPVDLDVDVDRLRSLSGVKWSKFGPDVLPAWVADTDLAPPQPVIDALRVMVEQGDFGYGRPAGPKLAEAFADFSEAEHRWRPDVDRLEVFANVLQAVELALWLHTQPGDGIVLFTPIYPPFLGAVTAAGRRLVDCPLDPDGWRLDPERLEAVVDESTTAILLCHPHNPTGRVFDRGELEVIAAVAEAHDLLVISDEVWSDLVHPGAEHLPFVMVDDAAADRTITVSAASKSFNLAGLRCAIAHMGHPGVAAAHKALPSHLLGAVNVMGSAATHVAWTQGRPYLHAVRRHLTVARDHLADRLAADLPEIGWQIPQATYLAWLDLRALDLGPDPAEVLMERAGVALSHGPTFGIHGEGFARLNFATSIEILDSIVDRMVDVIGS